MDPNVVDVAVQLTLFQELLRTMSLMSVNLIYAILGIAIGIYAMAWAYKVFDDKIPGNTGEKLMENPLAIGIVVAGIMVGIGICVGQIIGLSLN